MQLSYGSTSPVTLTDQVFECPAKPPKAVHRFCETDLECALLGVLECGALQIN